MGLKDRIIDEIEAVGGRHDEVDVYGGPPGDPGLCGGPDGMSWEINGDMASVGLAGPAAVIMEVLHPSVMAGVYEQSSYRTQPLLRARNTLGYVLRTTFGNTEAATGLIERVKRVHSRINGTRPDGVPYRALDPELIAWVHTCIPWAIMTAYERTCRPLTIAEKDRYLTEQAVVGRMGGADWVPGTVAELETYVDDMAPKLSVNEQTAQLHRFPRRRHPGAGRRESMDAVREPAGPPRLDEPAARLVAPPDRAVPPGARPTPLVRPDQPPAGERRALGLPLALQGAGARAHGGSRRRPTRRPTRRCSPPSEGAPPTRRPLRH